MSRSDGKWAAFLRRSAGIVAAEPFEADRVENLRPGSITLTSGPPRVQPLEYVISFKLGTLRCRAWVNAAKWEKPEGINALEDAKTHLEHWASEITRDYSACAATDFSRWRYCSTVLRSPQLAARGAALHFHAIAAIEVLHEDGCGVVYYPEWP